ncbi:hypothetical protein A3H22_00850 [Candidatus Peribacteria bacterium RIFCSPLOWO2_12_FULL_55_15]|nr:MAG: hypothetical protein A2789_00610 [Candidatus Peribacteria bacterium RIFCSPHIGHO2_01_FULL_54_22]OGJ63561.1 MAG: hypothetical protein A3D12_03885 [Candidatus Peribacteria bacterium RIFCSPHIGHO2_02_FULL_55_24]OGJ63820.1 MAG: hypothetical protein A3E47_01750 [Candidatus Peribacteria bacterium RIFCSPHIGHO2_12_FULL_54_10]OGJ67649.1 MAG: hypothetical protein A2947_00635 [Candidatus Peribacteria bacterium RIFCSPLOWO2_01_FULL_54_110]OGJ69548.1 MAG: hypothetical protein A3H90_02785 [Candidatus Pe
MDGSAPATKADVRQVENGLKADVQRLERKFDEKFERLYETDDQILNILGNIDKRLTPKIEDHEHRITRLEEAMV